MKYSIAALTAISAMLLWAVVLVSGCTAGAAGDGLKAGLPDDSSYSIEIVGGTNGPVTLTYADIEALGLVKKEKVAHPDSLGLTITDDYVGIPLMKVIEKAGIPAGEHAYNVSGLDGSHALYTKDQAGRGLIALKRGDTALGEDLDDPITAILPGGPFCHWISSPSRIEIIDGTM